MFGIQDLFVVGIGFDIAGAWLLALGLIESPSTIAWYSTEMRRNDAPLIAGRIEDRVRGLLGLVALVLGFGLQGLGYALAVSLEDPSSGNALGVLISVLAPIGAVWILYRLIYGRLARRAIADVARAEMQDAMGGDEEFSDLPSASRMFALEMACGLESPDDLSEEQEEEYLRKRFGAKNASY